MALTRQERFTLKAELIDAISGDHSKWTFDKINLLLGEFDCEQVPRFDSDFEFSDSIKALNEADLIAMHALVTGKESPAASPQHKAELQLGNAQIWAADGVRLFLSHSAVHKKFAAQVAEEMKSHGISGFVAHDSMEVEKTWQDQIELGLRTMDALVVLLHTEVNSSAWCQQEIGWALGSAKPIYVVRLAADPAGFIGRTQWPSCGAADAKQAAREISSWVMRQPQFASPLVDASIKLLAEAQSWAEAHEISLNLVQALSLTPGQWEALDSAYLNNDQVSHGWAACNVLERFYTQQGRSWPPVPEPVAPAPVPANPWGSFDDPF